MKRKRFETTDPKAANLSTGNTANRVVRNVYTAVDEDEVDATSLAADEYGCDGYC
jgi:hypothetical protein